MKRPLGRLIGFGLLGAVAACGCNQVNRGPARISEPVVVNLQSVPSEKPVTKPTAPINTEKAASPIQPPMIMPPPESVIIPKERFPQGLPVKKADPSSPTSKGTSLTVPKESSSVTSVGTRSEVGADIKQASMKASECPIVETAEPHKSFAEMLATPCYGHAADYSWLTGALEQVQPSRAWLLHYASVGEEDPHGGCVTLTELGPMNQFTDGQCVRVEGQFVPSSSKERNPAYGVRSIQPVNP